MSQCLQSPGWPEACVITIGGSGRAGLDVTITTHGCKAQATANFLFLVIGVSEFLIQRCCQMYTFSVGLCFQEGGSGVYCTAHPLNPGPNIGTVAAASVVSRPLLATLHYEAPLKLGHWDHQPTSRVRFEKMSNILKWYLSDAAVWAGPAWQGWWCQQFGPNIILIYWHHPPALLQEYEILLI